LLIPIIYIYEKPVQVFRVLHQCLKSKGKALKQKNCSASLPLAKLVNPVFAKSSNAKQYTFLVSNETNLITLFL
jgi:hypothetical protein